ncbi:MAG TPA: tetratricopeptide repeat protein [Chryseosolibacter sp.]|nr:tetratricopeptide repeat protein [Chryseosolibacter sp.]
MKFRSLFLLTFFFLTYQTFSQHQLSQTKNERLFQKGYELITHAQYGAARKIFSEYLDNTTSGDPRRADARYYVAFSALSLNHTDGEKLIDQFVSDYPSSPRATTAYFDLANFFYDEKSYSKASVYYRKAEFGSLTSSQQNEGHFKWGYSYFNLKRFDEALEQFNLVKGSSSEYTPAANYYAGYIAFNNGDYEQSLKDLRKAESNASYNSVVPFMIASVYYKQGRYDDLIQYANSVKTRKVVANANEFSMLTAEAYYYRSDFRNAAERYDDYLGDNPAKAEAPLLFRAGFANYSLDQPKKAIDYLGRAAASKDSVKFYASYYMGILYLKQGEKNLAINAFDVARKNPTNEELAEEAAFQYAKLMYDVGKPEQAITDFEKFLSDYPASSHRNETKELLAQAYANGNNYHKAIEYIESLPSRNPQIEQAYQKATFLKGVELFNKDDYQSAVESFEKSITSPRDQKLLMQAGFWAGESYSAGGRYADALRHYERVLSMPSSIDPETYLKAKYGAGYAYYNLQNYEKALLNFRDFVNRSSRADADHADALIRLADCYYVSKEYAAAIESYNRARSAGSTDQDYIFLQTGTIYGIQRNYETARSQLTTLINSYPKSPYRDEALFQRAQFEIEAGRYQAAADGLSQLINDSPGSKYLPYAYMRRAASNYNLKKYDATISDYATVLSKFSTHPVAQEALLPLQDALNAAGKSGEFDKYLTAFKTANPDNKNLEQIEFDTGKNLFFDQQYENALIKLNAFVASYPASASLTEAKYYIAESHYRLDDFDKALSVYKEVVNDKTFSMINRVEGRISEILFSKGEFNEAITHYHTLERIATNKKEQYNAWAGLMESFYKIGLYDSSSTYATIIIEKGAVNASAHNKASLFLGKNAYAKGDFETAQDEFLNTVNAAQDEFGAEAKYMIAMILYQQKQFKASYETLISLTNDFSAYDEWVGKAYLLIADNFIGLENTFQAKATLQSIIDNFPLENIREQAKSKLVEIEKLEAERKAAAVPDTTTIDK